jgi:hypothetical protein
VVYPRLTTGERYDKGTQCGFCVGVIQGKGNIPAKRFIWMNVIIGNLQSRFP